MKKLNYLLFLLEFSSKLEHNIS